MLDHRKGNYSWINENLYIIAKTKFFLKKKYSRAITKQNRCGGAVVRTLALQAEGWVLKSQLRQTYDVKNT